MLNNFWIRLHLSYLDDPDFMQLPNETKWHFVAMYLLAKKADAGGLLAANNKPLNAKNISFLLNDDLDSVSKSIDLLVENDFLILDNNHLEIYNYAEEQQITLKGSDADNKKEKDRIRQQNHRLKIKEKEFKKQNKNKDLELDLETKTEQDTEEETEIDTDIETDTETEGSRDMRDSHVTSQRDSDDEERFY